MPLKETLQHDDYEFTFERLTDQTVIFSVQRDKHSKQETFLNKEACIKLATKLLNAAEGLE
jgi:hypothetical protein